MTEKYLQQPMRMTRTGKLQDIRSLAVSEYSHKIERYTFKITRAPIEPTPFVGFESKRTIRPGAYDYEQYPSIIAGKWVYRKEQDHD